MEKERKAKSKNSCIKGLVGGILKTLEKQMSCEIKRKIILVHCCSRPEH